MSDALTSALSRVEGVLDNTVSYVRDRLGLWHDIHILPYHGYARPDRVRLFGRVLDDREVDDEGELSVLESARLTARRFISDEVPGAELEIRLGDTTVRTQSDEDGYYDVEFEPSHRLGGGWHEATVRLVTPQTVHPVGARARFVVPPEDARFLTISDVDDTVMLTGATDKLRFARVVLFNNATTREVFPGVGALYRALTEAEGGTFRNPMFYVSSSPWNLYRQFMGTFAHRDVPEGPLFLKDFGIDPGKLIKTGHHGHKLEQIEKLLSFYPDLDAVLIGDSGQEDAEIYQRAVAQHAGRIQAVFIRDVTEDARDEAVRTIARDVEARGVPMHLVASTEEAAIASADLGLIEADDVARVREAAARESNA